MGTRLGELLFPLMHRVLTKSLPFITARIQKSNWVRVWGTGGNVMNILTAASGIAPATVTRLRIQLFRERLSEKVHETIPKGIMGDFEVTVLQRKSG